MPQNSFAQKRLRVTFTLSTNAAFSNTDNANTLVLTGLRTLAVVKGLTRPAWPEAELTIFGMAQSDMNALCSLAYNLEQVARNSVQIDADSGNGFSTIFSGQIVNGYIDYSGAPDVSFKVQARALYLQSLETTPAISYPGPTDAVQIIQTLAVKSGYQFENNGVKAQLSSPYCAGTAGDQIEQICKAIGCQRFIEGNVLAIAPPGVPRSLPGFTLSPSSGLVGYPVAESRGYINVRALYNTAFRFGGPITIAGSDVVIDASTRTQFVNSRADGNWYVGTIVHNLEAYKFGGAWFSDMQLQPIGTAPTQP